MVEVLALGRDSLQEILGNKVEIVIYRNFQRWGIERNDIMKNLSDISKEKLLEKFEQKNIEKGQVILNAGDSVTQLIVCVQGEMLYEEDGVKTNYPQGK